MLRAIRVVQQIQFVFTQNACCSLPSHASWEQREKKIYEHMYSVLDVFVSMNICVQFWYVYVCTNICVQSWYVYVVGAQGAQWHWGPVHTIFSVSLGSPCLLAESLMVTLKISFIPTKTL